METAQRDRARFVDIYDRYFHRVWAYVIRRTANHAEAEDVTADVFHRALEHLKDYEWRGAPFFSWLRQIAANELADRWRERTRETGEPPDIEESPKDLERRAMLFQLVDRLPDAQRQVIELRFVEEKSLQEVADALGKSAGAVKQLQRRAIETLREQWEESRG